MKLFDTHAHVSGMQDSPTIIKASFQKEVGAIMNICTDLNTLLQGLELSNHFPNLYNTAAITPHDVLGDNTLYWDKIVESASKGLLKAIGETGLDYFYKELPKDLQETWLIRHLELAKACKLPVVIHCREAFEAFFDVYDRYPLERGFILHCFTGSKEDAKKVVERGGLVSLSGIVTYKKSQELREVASILPLEKIVVETDAPYLAPQSKRGQVCTPSDVKETVQMIASIRGLDPEEVAKVTFENAAKFFKIEGI